MVFGAVELESDVGGMDVALPSRGPSCSVALVEDGAGCVEEDRTGDGVVPVGEAVWFWSPTAGGVAAAGSVWQCTGVSRRYNVPTVRTYIKEQRTENETI